MKSTNGDYYNGDPKSGHVRILNGLPGSGFRMVSGFQMVNSLDHFKYIKALFLYIENGLG